MGEGCPDEKLDHIEGEQQSRGKGLQQKAERRAGAEPSSGYL